MTSPELVLEGLLEAQKSLDQSQQWKLRPATVSVAGAASFVGTFDGEGFDGVATVNVPMISLVGYVGVGQRVMVMTVPPQGNYAIAQLPSSAGDWIDYTPSFTGLVSDPNVGPDGHVLGRWKPDGPRTIITEIDILFGTSGTSAGSGRYFVSTPFTVSARSIAAATGACYMLDAGTANRAGIVNVSTDGGSFFITNTPNGDVGSANPHAWTINDALRFTIITEIDSF